MHKNDQDLLSALPAISLDELNAQAAMLTRLDRKYLLRHADVREVIEKLPAGTTALEIDGKREQHYRTTYFDTPDMLAYRMTAQKRRRRFKVRQRTYVDSQLAFCEVKTKGPRGHTVKTRIPIDPAHAHNGDIAPEAWDFLHEALPGELGAQVLPNLIPILDNSYVRSTIRTPGVGRATIDSQLEWKSAAGEELNGLDLVFIETKSGSRPSPVDRALWQLGHRPTSVSKFGTGLAAMHPDLPANKWHRTLDRHFVPDIAA